MKLSVLGSGTCIPNKHRGSSGYAVELGDAIVLLDCGNGTTWKLGHVGIDYLGVDHIFITHFHPDHTADLIPFLFARKYPTAPNNAKPLSVWGPMGFRDFFAALQSAYGDWILPDDTNIREIDTTSVELTSFKIRTSKSLHTHNSFSYRIDSGGKSLVYSGDTDYTRDLVELSAGADLLILECSFPDDMKREGHLTPSDVVRVVRESGVNRVVVTHMYPMLNEAELLNLLQKELPETDVIIAQDLLQIEI